MKPLLPPPLRAMRPHQWAKNFFIFVPLITSQLFTPNAIGRALWGFAAFCFAASAGYIVNDLIDAPHDRQNPAKRTRPIASGELGAPCAVTIASALLLASALTTWGLGDPRFALILGGYLALSVAYSAFFKRYFFVDVVTLTALYSIRIVAGAAVIDVELSLWLAAFSLTTFLGLALLKRYVELLEHLGRTGKEGGPSGRPYSSGAMGMVSLAGRCFGYGSVAVLALYLSSSNVGRLYNRLPLLWTLPPLFFWWVHMVWKLAREGRMHHDPVAFAVRDWRSWLIAALALAVLLFARRGGGSG